MSKYTEKRLLTACRNQQEHLHVFAERYINCIKIDGEDVYVDGDCMWDYVSAIQITKEDYLKILNNFIDNHKRCIELLEIEKNSSQNIMNNIQQPEVEADEYFDKQNIKTEKILDPSLQQKYVFQIRIIRRKNEEGHPYLETIVASHLKDVIKYLENEMQDENVEIENITRLNPIVKIL